MGRALKQLGVGVGVSQARVMGEPPAALVEALTVASGVTPSNAARDDAEDIIIVGAHLDRAGLSALQARLATIRAGLKPGGLLVAHVRTFAAAEAHPAGGGAWDHLLFPAMTRSGEITGEAAGLTPLFISGWVMALESAGLNVAAMAGPSGVANAGSLQSRHAERLAVFDEREIAATELLIIARAVA